MSHLRPASAFRQVGSFIAEPDADGELAATHRADAWGNRLEDWDTGVWGGDNVPAGGTKQDPKRSSRPSTSMNLD